MAFLWGIGYIRRDWRGEGLNERDMVVEVACGYYGSIDLERGMACQASRLVR